jgi:glutathione S-transferase
MHSSISLLLTTMATTTKLLQNCTLTYFGIPGRGEAVRLALAVGGISFTDHRVAFADWKSLKAQTPWASLPVLTLADGAEIAQQRAILRLIGKVTALYPTDDIMAAARVDSLMDAAEDIGQKTNAAGQGMAQAEKLAAREAAFVKGGAVYPVLANVDKFIAAHGQGGYAVGDALTIADLMLYTATSSLLSGMFDGVPATALDDFAHITALRKMVRSYPSVVKYYDSLDAAIKTGLPASFDAIQ